MLGSSTSSFPRNEELTHGQLPISYDGGGSTDYAGFICVP